MFTLSILIILLIAGFVLFFVTTSIIGTIFVLLFGDLIVAGFIIYCVIKILRRNT